MLAYINSVLIFIFYLKSDIFGFINIYNYFVLILKFLLTFKVFCYLFIKNSSTFFLFWKYFFYQLTIFLIL